MDWIFIAILIAFGIVGSIYCHMAFKRLRLATEALERAQAVDRMLLDKLQEVQDLIHAIEVSPTLAEARQREADDVL